MLGRLLEKFGMVRIKRNVKSRSYRYCNAWLLMNIILFMVYKAERQLISSLSFNLCEAIFPPEFFHSPQAARTETSWQKRVGVCVTSLQAGLEQGRHIGQGQHHVSQLLIWVWQMSHDFDTPLRVKISKGHEIMFEKLKPNPCSPIQGEKSKPNPWSSRE